MPKHWPPKQWDVWRVCLREGDKCEQTGEHFAVVLSPPELASGGVAVVAPITSTKHYGTWVVPVAAGDAGLDHDSFVECNQLQPLAISPKRFLQFGGRLSEGARSSVALALNDVFAGVFVR
jgi:mRNA-degrading endonuclease toxin of MazEF toxin-antitoxin module